MITDDASRRPCTATYRALIRDRNGRRRASRACGMAVREYLRSTVGGAAGAITLGFIAVSSADPGRMEDRLSRLMSQGSGPSSRNRSRPCHPSRADLPVLRIRPRSPTRAPPALPELSPADRRPPRRRSTGLPCRESAVPIFDRERQRLLDEATWTVERERGSPSPRASTRRRPGANASRGRAVGRGGRGIALPLPVERRAGRPRARRRKRWPEVARTAACRRRRCSPRPVRRPGPGTIVGIQRDGCWPSCGSSSGRLHRRGAGSDGCCRACRADDGKVFKIVAELRNRGFRTIGCPKGLCGCEWWLAMPVPKKHRRKKDPWSSAATDSRRRAGRRTDDRRGGVARDDRRRRCLGRPVDAEHLPDA